MESKSYFEYIFYTYIDFEVHSFKSEARSFSACIQSIPCVQYIEYKFNNQNNPSSLHILYISILVFTLNRFPTIAETAKRHCFALFSKSWCCSLPRDILMVGMWFSFLLQSALPFAQSWSMRLVHTLTGAQ